MPEQQSHLTVKDSGGVSVVEFSDRKILDELSIAELTDELSRIIAKMKEVKLLLNFKNVEHLSSAALSMLITLNKQVNERKGALKLSDIAPPIYEVFKITRLNKMFSIYDTARDALDDF